LKKVKYYYSTKTQQFEPLKVPIWKKLLRVFGFISAILVCAAVVVALAFKYLQSPNEKRMNAQLNYLEEKYTLMKKDLRKTQEQVDELEKRDNNVYRVIFEADPLPDSIRNGRILVDERALEKRLSPFNNEELVTHLEQSMQALKNKLNIQQKSYDTLQRFIEQKQEMLASIPSIQPVSNKQLERIASGFGARIDPIYKIMKFHAGLDFTAPIGTPIYATGNGTVESADYHESGFGNHIWIKHGYGYRTHYCHMVKMKSKPGQTVKRGEVIGWVGSTGKSTGPHCHYEVEKGGEKLDPIHFFYNDLKPEDFERMVKIAAAGNQSFD
jgi:murein DD-endopeptidase MepM/ murein hydrolase activator NlpD